MAILYQESLRHPAEPRLVLADSNTWLHNAIGSELKTSGLSDNENLRQSLLKIAREQVSPYKRRSSGKHIKYQFPEVVEAIQQRLKFATVVNASMTKGTDIVDELIREGRSLRDNLQQAGISKRKIESRVLMDIDFAVSVHADQLKSPAEKFIFGFTARSKTRRTLFG
jgi:hypothetical protein